MTARSGMTDLITDLRSMTGAGTADWTDDQLQIALDKCKTFVIDEPLSAHAEMSGGSVVYQNYSSAYGNFEATTGGTAIFQVKDGLFNTVASSNYSVDYRAGVITFNANTTGLGYYLSGRSYDLNRAAADIWRQKAAIYASAYDISTDNQSLKRSQLVAQALQMVSFFEGQSGATVVQLRRGDE